MPQFRRPPRQTSATPFPYHVAAAPIRRFHGGRRRGGKGVMMRGAVLGAESHPHHLLSVMPLRPHTRIHPRTRVYAHAHARGRPRQATPRPRPHRATGLRSKAAPRPPCRPADHADHAHPRCAANPEEPDRGNRGNRRTCFAGAKGARRRIDAKRIGKGRKGTRETARKGARMAYRRREKARVPPGAIVRAGVRDCWGGSHPLSAP